MIVGHRTMRGTLTSSNFDIEQLSEKLAVATLINATYQ